MKYGFLSDIHGDLNALERALDCLREADRLVFLGDVLGGRHDRECLARLRSIPDLICVPGNHDLWDCELTGLPSDSQDYLRGLTLEQRVEDWLAVHSDYECDPGGAVRFP